MSDPPVPRAASGLSASSWDPDPKRWTTFLASQRKGGEDEKFLTHQLSLWCRAQGLTDAALYGTDCGEIFEFQVGFGAVRFPKTWKSGEDGGWCVVELPQTRLLHSPPTRQIEPGPELMLLAASARISDFKRRLQEQSFQARFRGVELEALYEVGLAIASTLDLEELCDETLLRAVSLLDARRGALYLLEEDDYRLTSRFGGEAKDRFALKELDLAALEAGESQGPTGWLPGAEHLLGVPVEIEGDPRGLLVVADKESRRGVGPFPPTDRRTLSLFANQAAIAIENAKLHKLALEKERLEREMELAAEIQQQILPKTMPAIGGYEVLGWNRPARHAGGDYFDLKGLGSDHWGLVVGDVTGKGLPAALLVSTLHSALRVLYDSMEAGPSLMSRLNRHIYESSAANKFITLLLGVLEVENSRLAYLNAGHNPGLLLRPDGSVEQLSSAGLPLGLLPQGSYGVSTCDLAPGDLVCLYSDGITECESPEEEEFGLDRLAALLEEHRNAPLPELIAAIDRAVTDFAQDLPQGDDQTVLLLRRLES